MNLAGIIGKRGASRVTNSIGFAPEMKLTQMPFLPAHRYLEDMVQLRQRRVAPHVHAPVDLGTDAQHMNLKLIAPLPSSQGLRRDGLSYGLHRQLRLYKVASKGLNPTAPHFLMLSITWYNCLFG